MIIHTMPQRSEEWFAVRCGKFTASDFGVLMSSIRIIDEFNKTQMAILYRVAAERATGKPMGGGFISQAMQHGIDFEDEARVSYMLETGFNVSEVGFVELDDWTGCSPDGLVGDDGGLEIKCPNSDTHLRYFRNPKDLFEDYYWQCMAGMFCSGRRWWDLYSYDPRFEREDMRTVRIRLAWNDSEIDKMKARIANARLKVEAML